MRLKSFKGGIHPHDEKKRTNRVPVVPHMPGKEIVIPLRQHIGAPCEPVVSVGDHVLMGQLIGKSTSFVSANVHASVSGTVTKIAPYMHPGGGEATAIFIENDFEDTLDPSITKWDLDETPQKAEAYIAALDPKTIVERVQAAGITGMGGASFPVHVKLSPPPDCPIDTVIINGAECEPFLTSDHRRMLEDTRIVIIGSLMIARAVNAKRVVISVENNKPDAIEALQNVAADYKNVEIGIMRTKYPQGSEKQLIEAITHRQVPSGGLPAKVGVVVNNIDTCVAVANAVVRHMPLIERIVTVSGDCVAKPTNFRVRIGVKFADLFEAAGGFTEPPHKIVMGGPMMGMAQSSLQMPVIKGTSGILAFRQPPTYGKDEGQCIKCGKCVEVCPMRLMPNALSVYAKYKNVEKLQEYNILDCMECGSCTYICPQRRFIVQHIKMGKLLLKK